MSYQAILLVLGLMALGAGLVAWPLILMVQAARVDLLRSAETIKGLELALQRAVDAAKVQVHAEQTIDDARDLAPRDELRVLLDPDRDPAPKPTA